MNVDLFIQALDISLQENTSDALHLLFSKFILTSSEYLSSKIANYEDALVVAIQKNKKEVFKLLLSKTDSLDESWFFHTSYNLLDIVLKKGDKDFVILLLSKIELDHDSLKKVIRNNDLSAINLLLSLSPASKLDLIIGILNSVKLEKSNIYEKLLNSNRALKKPFFLDYFKIKIGLVNY